MAYQITLSNGSVLVNIGDNTLDNSTSLTLVGKDFVGYGTMMADNFVRLLENAANHAAPARPLVGQLWYDTANSLMKVWTGTAWFSMVTGVSSVVGQTGAVTFAQLLTSGLAPAASPILTGIPQAPTASVGTRTNQIASTAFVQVQVEALKTGVISVVGVTGAVTLSQLVNGGVAPLASPALTGVPSAPTAANGTSTTQLATTAFVNNQIGALSSGVVSVLGNTGVVTLLQMTNGGLAPILTPSFTGVPKAPTAAPLTSTNQLATTAFVTNAIAALPATPASQKIRLVAAGNLYVSPAGNDSNDGTSLTTAFLTLQHAWNTVLYNYNLNGFLLTINVADGTYNGVVCCGAPTGAALIADLATFNLGSSYGSPSPVKFKSSSGNAANCIVSTSNAICFSASFGAQIDVDTFTLQAAGAPGFAVTNGTAVSAAYGGYIGVYNNIFGVCGNSHIESYGGLIGLGASNTIKGGAIWHYNCTRRGTINALSTTVQVVGAPAFSGGFALSEHASYIEGGGITFLNAGSVVGCKFLAQFGGIISTDGADVNYFPGNSPGAVDSATFGLYI